MANDPEQSNYQQYLARLKQGFQSRSSTVIIVAIALVTVIAIILFIKALPPGSPSRLATHSGSATTQSIAQLSAPQQQPELQPAPSQTPTVPPPAKEIRPGDETRPSQASDSLRTLSTLQQQLDQIKQEQEKQLQTIASQLELITRQQEISLQAAGRMATQILELSQKAAAVSTQHQASVQAIAALETRIGNSQAQEAPLTSGPGASAGNTAPPVVTATATPRLPDLHLAGVSSTTLSNGGLQLQFDPAIFDRDDHFKIGAKARLRDAAKVLVQSQEGMVVYVVGLAAAEPNTWPWLEPRSASEMALLRACRVSTYLESLGIFPPGAILPRAGSPDDFPFAPGDINNRTVLLRIFPQSYARYSNRK
jgi:hypothetical protein